ncbi:alkaline phosphatase family protein [Halobellus inordinatus]|uniref:alkaline phosphatase family protein n=1 Tax=Halobellus inordinatus TaxID=1126236 RepID=UPI00210B2225|nr:alkaline phosphatase family protein [Halobellus inordinatus]
MTLIVFGIDAMDPDLVEPDRHPHLTLDSHRSIETIISASGEPNTHELWPTIITGLHPDEHGLVIEDGVAWDNQWLNLASDLAEGFLPKSVRTKIGMWLLNTTDQDAFRTPATYYSEHNLSTVFDGHEATAIGVPNYVTDTDETDREHELRKSMGDLFERDPDATGGHSSADPLAFYDQCVEMIMVRTARTRAAHYSSQHELVFGYTSGLDLIGHITYDWPGLQETAYDVVDGAVADLVEDLDDDDELLLVSDHGLQDGLHTDTAMVASTDPALVDGIESVLDLRETIEAALSDGRHVPAPRDINRERDAKQSARVKGQLEDLGYI